MVAVHAEQRVSAGRGQFGWFWMALGVSFSYFDARPFVEGMLVAAVYTLVSITVVASWRKWQPSRAKVRAAISRMLFRWAVRLER